MSTLLPDALVTDVLVRDVIEAETRRLMAERAALPKTWTYRAERRELGKRIDDHLERFNWLTLRR